MIKQIEQVAEFHKAFGIHISEFPIKPTKEIADLRSELIYEEEQEVSQELWDYKSNNLDKIAKELADLIYVAYGTVLAYGLQHKFEAVFDEVHRSNMSKLDENGQVIKRHDGKILKSNLYKAANIEDILYKSGRSGDFGVIV